MLGIVEPSITRTDTFNVHLYRKYKHCCIYMYTVMCTNETYCMLCMDMRSWECIYLPLVSQSVLLLTPFLLPYHRHHTALRVEWSGGRGGGVNNTIITLYMYIHV